ncbi:CYP39A1 [Bugula neritina]|uniref:CYP39A1 n=1 Tax=Bugula neritina TaxID=10212 RepID=A0A7J7JXW8_BUGNE|nr:CYP39A1 [Bugula neritina]KAF6031001.1 CYP39A1 [Bugula neritina]
MAQEFNAKEWFFFPAIIGLLLYIAAQVYKRNRLYSVLKLPPCYSGWMPFLGCAIEFGKEPLNFIEKMHRKLGPVYTLYIGGKRMTYLTDEEDYNKYFMQSQHVDFQKAVHLFVANAASIPSESFLTHHTSIHDLMKGKLATNQLPSHSKDLQTQFERRLAEISLAGSCELNEVIRLIMYPSVIRNLFGEDVLPIHNEESMNKLMVNFVAFDDQFEYGTQIPHVFIRKWAQSKQWLLNVFRKAILQIKSTDDTVLKSLYEMVDKEHGANYSLLMLWASLANAIPITFWTVAMILNDPKVHERVIKEISAAQDSSGNIEYNTATFEKLKYIRCCFLEAIRIRSPGVITRMVVKSFNVKGYNVPAGDLLFLSPHWTHRNEKYFPDAEKYMPERWLTCDFTKNEFLPGFVAFGGGRYMCPGRWYAIMELHMIITMLFHKYSMTLESTLPKANVMHLVGVQQPDADCYVRFSPKL